MRKWIFILVMIAGALVFFSFDGNNESAQNLRKIYSQSPDKWPAPNTQSGVIWKELGILPPSPLDNSNDSIKNIIELGKALFFDTRLSGSGTISCASCHKPELSWTDGRSRSVGHEGALTKRNSPTLQNVWFFDKLFWDGRAKDLQDQAFAPINSETEMHSEMPDVLRKLRKVKGYGPLFKKAFGSEEVTPDNFTEAIAMFEKTIVSRKNRFDEFLEGNKKALTSSEIRGLHVFRTKAGCMNCHNGPLFSDNQFHRTNLGGAMGPDNDYGLYNVTHIEADKGKFKTPSLRDIMYTRPWLHNGSVDDIETILTLYQKRNPLPSGFFQPLRFTGSDRQDLRAFLEALSTRPLEFTKPVIPE